MIPSYFGIGDGNEMLLFLSNEDDLDRRFVAKVKQRLKESTLATEQNAD